ncbi:hypothetical protein GIB67_001702, partial [Kingdonia uniflora]
MDCLEWELLDQNILIKVRSILSSSISSKLPKVSTVFSQAGYFINIVEIFGDYSHVIPFGSSLLTLGDYSDVELKGKRVSHIENGSKSKVGHKKEDCRSTKMRRSVKNRSVTFTGKDKSWWLSYGICKRSRLDLDAPLKITSGKSKLSSYDEYYHIVDNGDVLIALTNDNSLSSDTMQYVSSMARNMFSSQLSDLSLLAAFGDDGFTIMKDTTILAWDKRQVTFLWTCNANDEIIGVVTSMMDSRAWHEKLCHNETDWFDVFTRCKAWVEIETGSMLNCFGSNDDGDKFCCDKFVIDKTSFGIKRLEKIPIILQEFGIADSVVCKITERARSMKCVIKFLKQFRVDSVVSAVDIEPWSGFAREFIKDLARIRPRAILNINKSGENFRISTSTKMSKQGTCECCGYISSHIWCKACVLLDGLNRDLPKLGIGQSKGNAEHWTLDILCILYFILQLEICSCAILTN